MVREHQEINDPFYPEGDNIFLPRDPPLPLSHSPLDSHGDTLPLLIGSFIYLEVPNAAESFGLG